MSEELEAENQGVKIGPHLTVCDNSGFRPLALHLYALRQKFQTDPTPKHARHPLHQVVQSNE